MIILELTMLELGVCGTEVSHHALGGIVSPQASNLVRLQQDPIVRTQFRFHPVGARLEAQIGLHRTMHNASSD